MHRLGIYLFMYFSSVTNILSLISEAMKKLFVFITAYGSQIDAETTTRVMFPLIITFSTSLRGSQRIKFSG